MMPMSVSTSPMISIEDSSIEIIDARRGSGDPLVLRDVNLNIEPATATTTPNESTGSENKNDAAAGGPILRVKGHLGGDHFERIDIEGFCNPSGGLWSIHGSVEDLAVSPRLIELLPPEIVSSKQLPEVRGRVNLKFDLGNPFQSVNHLLLFEFQLGWVLNVLPFASSTSAKMTTEWCFPQV